MEADRSHVVKWPLRRGAWIDAAWIAFSVANLGGMLVFPDWETVPFHFIWVSVTLLYGFRVWKVRSTAWTLAAEGHEIPRLELVHRHDLLMAHAAIGLGTLSGGWRIVRTMGQKITALRPVGDKHAVSCFLYP